MKMAGKAFALNLMQLVHLDGMCVRANHINPQAMVLIQHEEPHGRFIDPYMNAGRAPIGVHVEDEE